LVTFGGAYAVLPYIASAAVERFGWLSAGAMLDGLGLAETTPGPLIMVVQFVGFLGGWNHPEGLPPWLGGLIGACISTWVTFVPCFLWILLGAPYVESLRSKRGLSAALACVTAAVVGVVLNLAVWFALNTLFKGGSIAWSTLDLPSFAIAALVFACLARWNIGVQWIVIAGGLLGLARHLL
jgi:chromate transporter